LKGGREVKDGMKARSDGDSVDRIAEAWEAAVPEYRTDATHVMTRIQHLARFFEDGFARVGRAHGLAAGDVYVLLALRRAPGRLTPTELFRELSVTAGAISKRVDRLASLGFVSRHAVDADGRSVQIALTPAGRSLIDDEILFGDEFVFRAAYELTAGERADLTHLLRRFLSLMERQSDVDVGPKGALGRKTQR
jgi:DNA-binding MarR family transcriptional regulator